MQFSELSENDKKTIKECLAKLGNNSKEEPKGFFCSRKDMQQRAIQESPKEMTEKEKMIKQLRGISQPKLME